MNEGKPHQTAILQRNYCVFFFYFGFANGMNKNKGKK